MAPALTLGAIAIGAAAVASIILVNALVTLCKAPEQTSYDLADSDPWLALNAPVHATPNSPEAQHDHVR